jgi:hypothetical protein
MENNRQLHTVCTIPPVLFTAGIIPNKLHDSLKLLLLPAPCTKQQYLTHAAVRNVFGRTVNKKCLVIETVLFGEPAELL